MNQEQVEAATRQRKEERQRVEEWRAWRKNKRKIWYLDTKPMVSKKC